MQCSTNNTLSFLKAKSAKRNARSNKHKKEDEQAEEEVNENDETASESQNARTEEETFAAWVRYLDDHNLTTAELRDLCLENCDDYDRKKHKKKAQLLELAKTALPSPDHPFYYELESDD